jgi:hypothetical protein
VTGKKSISSTPSGNSVEATPRPSFDTSIKADVRGRKLFDNMKKSEPKVINSSNNPLSSSISQPSSPNPSSSLSIPLTATSNPSQWLLAYRRDVQCAMDQSSGKTIRSLSLNECREMVISLLDAREQQVAKITQKIKTLLQENNGREGIQVLISHL